MVREAMSANHREPERMKDVSSSEKRILTNRQGHPVSDNQKPAHGRGKWGDEPIERYTRAKLFSTAGKQTVKYHWMPSCGVASLTEASWASGSGTSWALAPTMFATCRRCRLSSCRRRSSSGWKTWANGPREVTGKTMTHCVPNKHVRAAS